MKEILSHLIRKEQITNAPTYVYTGLYHKNYPYDQLNGCVVMSSTYGYHVLNLNNKLRAFISNTGRAIYVQSDSYNLKQVKAFIRKRRKAHPGIKIKKRKNITPIDIMKYPPKFNSFQELEKALDEFTNFYTCEVMDR